MSSLSQHRYRNRYAENVATSRRESDPVGSFWRKRLLWFQPTLAVAKRPCRLGLTATWPTRHGHQRRIGSEPPNTGPGCAERCRVERACLPRSVGRLRRNGLLLLYIGRFWSYLFADRRSRRRQALAGVFSRAFGGIKIGNKNPKAGNCYAFPLLSHATAQFSPGSTMILRTRNYFVIMNEGDLALTLRAFLAAECQDIFGRIKRNVY